MTHTAVPRPLLLALTVVLGLGGSVPAHAFNLLDAWRAARDYDAGFAANRAARDAGVEQRALGRAQLLPQLNARGDYSYSRTIEPNYAGASGDAHGYSLNLSQPLFDVPRYAASRQGAALARQAEAGYDVAQQQLMLNVAQRYFEVLLAEDSLQAIRAAKAAFAKQLEQARAAFEVGTATIVDTHEAQAGFDAAQAREIAAQSDLEIKREALRSLTGLDPAAIQHLGGGLQPSTSPLALEAWQQRAEQFSPDLRQQQQALEASEQLLLSRRGAQLPNVGLTASWHDTVNHGSGLSNPQNRGSSIGVGITLPLYAGGALNAQVREAAARVNEARERREATRRALHEAVRSAWLGVNNGAALVNAQQQLLVSAKAKLDATRLGKEVGVRSNLDLVQAEQGYHEAERALAEARYNYLLARLSLARQAGQLDEAALSEVNALLGGASAGVAVQPPKR